MLVPAVPDIMEDLKSTNENLATFAVSVYIFGYAMGQLTLAPISELYGYLPVYHVCNLGFAVFTIACGLSSNQSVLIVFRFFEGLFGSAPLMIGTQTIAKTAQNKQPSTLSIIPIGMLIGLAVGPVAGGFLTQARGWRWIFWVIAIIVSTLVFALVPNPRC